MRDTVWKTITIKLPLKPNQVTSSHVFPFSLPPSVLPQGFAMLGSLPFSSYCVQILFSISVFCSFFSYLNRQTCLSEIWVYLNPNPIQTRSQKFKSFFGIKLLKNQKELAISVHLAQFDLGISMPGLLQCPFAMWFWVSLFFHSLFWVQLKLWGLTRASNHQWKTLVHQGDADQTKS